MSIKRMSQVWETSDAKGSELLLEVAIADFANDDGEAWPSVETLAKKIRMSERNTQYLIKKLEARGALKVAPGAGPKGCNLFTLIAPEKRGANFAAGGAKQRQGGCKTASKGGAITVAPKQSVEPSKEPSERETRAMPPQNVTSTVRMESPRAVTVQSTSNREMFDLGGGDDPRFHTPYFDAVCRTTGRDAELLKMNQRERIYIAGLAVQLESSGYEIADLDFMRTEWPHKTPPNPSQIPSQIANYRNLRINPKANGATNGQPHNCESLDTIRIREIMERRAARNAAAEANAAP